MTEKTTKDNGPTGRDRVSKAGIVLLVLIAAGTILYAKQGQRAPEGSRIDHPAPLAQVHIDESDPGHEALSTSLDNEIRPRLVDLGADSCVPCRMMAPILEELRNDYAQELEVHFIDVWKDPSAGEEYGVQIIPTQIFYDASGVERFRHQGFLSKEDILAKWKELGVDLDSPSQEDTSVEAPKLSAENSGVPTH